MLFAAALIVAALGVLLVGLVIAARWAEARDVRRLIAADSFASVGAARIRYRLLHRADAPAVVLLSGMSSSLEEWAAVQDAVHEFATVLTYDRGGAGFSTGSRAHSAPEQAQELADLLRALGLRGPIVLVGYSVSASVARLFVEANRSVVSGLVLLDPYLPELEDRMVGRHGPFRMYGRHLIEELVLTMFGLRRFTAVVPREVPSDDRAAVAAKAAAATQRFAHWHAIVTEVRAMPGSSDRVKAAGGLTDIPVVIVTGVKPSSQESTAVVQQVYRDFVAQSRDGRIVTFTAKTHNDGLDVDASGGATVDAIRSLFGPTPTPPSPAR